MGEGMMTGGFGQYSYIGPFCHPHLQASSADPKDYSSTVWGGGQDVPIQAFPYPYYYYDKYRALPMQIGQAMAEPRYCPTSDIKNSLGWFNCTIVPNCERTVLNLGKAYTGSGTHIDVSMLTENDLACLNYLAYTAIDHARQVCTAVKTKAPSVPAPKKTGMQSPIPSNYVNGAPPSWWSSEAAKYCPKNSVCLPGPKIAMQPNPQVQFLAPDAGGDALEKELVYSVNETYYTKPGCLFGAQEVSVYDIAQVWQTTFPHSSIDTCAAAIISTQGECVTGMLDLTKPLAGRRYPGQPSVCSTAGGYSAGGIWQVQCVVGILYGRYSV